MPPSWLQDYLSRHNLTVNDIHQMLGVSRVTVYRWVNGTGEIPDLARLVIEDSVKRQDFFINEWPEYPGGLQGEDIIVEEERVIGAYRRSYIESPSPGERLREEREKMGFNQAELAAKLYVSPTMIHQCEVGKRGKKRALNPILIRGMFLERFRFAGIPVPVEYRDTPAGIEEEKADQLVVATHLQKILSDFKNVHFDDFYDAVKVFSRRLLVTSDFLEPPKEE